MFLYVFNWHKRRSKLVQQLKNFSIVSTLQIILKLVCTYIISKPIYVYFYLSQSITNDWIVHAIRQPFYRTARPIPTHGPIECTIGPTTLWSRIFISTPYDFIRIFYMSNHYINPKMTCLIAAQTYYVQQQ